VLVLAAVVLALLAPAARAHPGVSATALVKVDPRGRVTVILSHDALAFALDETPQSIADAPMYALLDASGPDLARTMGEARARFESLFELRADGRPVPFEVERFPTAQDVRAWLTEHPDRRLPVKLDVLARADLPAGARAFSFRFPDVLGDVIVTIDRPGVEPLTVPLRAGELTPALPIQPAAPDRAGAAQAERPAPAFSRAEVVGRYLRLGYTHIVPHGADHVLFVLGLFFLSPTVRALLWQITAFTVAHSITLGLTMLGLVQLSPSVVEPIIAASIVFVAVENVVTDRIHPWRPAVVFAFGLIHGMGFAGALRELGLPSGQLLPALVSFNVGVELGQLTVVAAAFFAVGWWRNRPWYRARIAVPASLAIAGVGLFWTIRRLAGA
jgi:hypothetical protein